MLKALFGSRPASFIRPRSFTASVAAHAALVAAVVVTTRGTGSDAHGSNRARQDAAHAVDVRYLTPPAKPAAATGDGRVTRERAVGAAHDDRRHSPFAVTSRFASLQASFDALTDRLAGLRPAVDVAEVLASLSAIDSQATAVADSEFSGAARLSDLVKPIMAVARNGIYTPDLVDEPVASRGGNPKPRYPEPLLAAGVEAAVRVRFVVDTTGRVDEPTIEFTTHVHQLFMDAIRASLRRARFFPARLAGTVVPQLVQQEFRFQLHGGR